MKIRKSVGYRWKDLGFEIFFGGLALVVILFLKLNWDESDLGKRFEAFVETELQRKLAIGAEFEEVGAMVVDIKNIKMEPVADGSLQMATSPDKLFPLIEHIVESRPKAIAVDIDFGPIHGKKFKHPKHPDFFRNIAELSAKEKVPIFLGVYDSQNEHPDQWLGAPEFASLAGGVVIPDRPYRAQF